MSQKETESYSQLLATCANFHAFTPIFNELSLFPSDFFLSLSVYILLCNSGTRENNEKNPRLSQTPSH